jgi:large subunit ribosomal protein L18
MKIVLKKRTSEKSKSRLVKRARVRKKIFGTPDRLRLSVFKSNTAVYAQLIDDTKGHTLLALSTAALKLNGSTDSAKKLGLEFGKRLLENGKGIIVFDRGGYAYHGKIKAVAEGVREAGVNI